MAAPKKYPDELRERAVRLYRSSTPRPTFRQLGEQLGVHHEALRNWVRRGGSPQIRAEARAVLWPRG
jgi:transposase